MNKICLSALLFFCAAIAQAQTVGTVSATATRMSTDTIKKYFLLKPGDEFTPTLYEKAQDDLHNLRVFKKLDFSATPAPDNKVDIHMDAQDGWYIFPLAFITGGSKSAAALSLTYLSGAKASLRSRAEAGTAQPPAWE